ncbi:hypothetical protein BT69DRAFT_1214862, partial [Atractiella rhizophila]
SFNSRFEIIPERNRGLNFQFDDVVRNKDERRKMSAAECSCCAGASIPASYYERAAETKAKQLGRDLLPDEVEDVLEGMKRQHQHKISRHRETWHKLATPPRFWEMGFPNTQQAVEWNDLGKEQTEKRMKLLEKEAM